MEKFNKICLGILKEAGEPRIDPTDLGDDKTIQFSDEPDGAADLEQQLGTQDQGGDADETAQKLINKFVEEAKACVLSFAGIKEKLMSIYDLSVQCKQSNPTVFNGIPERIGKNTNQITTLIGSFEQTLQSMPIDIKLHSLDKPKEDKTTTNT